MDNGHVPEPEASVNKTGLPEGTTVTWKTTPSKYTGQSSRSSVSTIQTEQKTKSVPITVKKQSDTFNPTAKQPGQIAKHGSEPSAEGSINTEDYQVEQRTSG